MDLARGAARVSGSARVLRGLSAVVLAAAVVTCAAGPAQADYNPVARQDASTGWMTDVSPSQVAAVLAYSGRNTVFGLGTDGGIWYRTDYSFAGWTAMPRTTTSGAVLTATSGPAAVSSDNGASVDVVVRGTDGGYWWTTGRLDADTGEPKGWLPWSPLRGSFTSAPSIGSIGADRLAIAGRGTDGAVWHRIYEGTQGWSNWVSLGGRAYSAPAVEGEVVGGVGRYVIYVVGTDLRIWQVPTSAQRGSAGDRGSWFGGQLFSAHGLGTINAWANPWRTDKRLTAGGGDHSVFLVDPSTGWAAPLGGYLTSTAAVLRQNTGDHRVFARGLDNALWYVDYYPGSHANSGWFSLGGQLR
jgi:hypothetical protein